VKRLVPILLLASPAAAQVMTDTSAIPAAVLNEPAIASCLETRARLDAALVAVPAQPMAPFLAPEVRVNAPRNIVSDHDGIVALQAADGVRYARFVRVIEHAAIRPTGECLLMGSETVDPTGKARLSGKRTVRRFTDLWRREGGRWLMTVRQASVIETRDLPAE
jgi:hypothetical protein